MVKGHFVYKDLIISQHPNVGLPFNKLISEVNPKRILEIGTANGGLTLLLRDLLNSNGLFDSTIRTYDILEQTNLKSKNVDGIEILTKSPFNYQYDGLNDPESIKKYIQQEGLTIVLCDGGSKKNEFKLLSNFLKNGDIIMAHDYVPNEEIFERSVKNKIWDWMEIQLSDVEQSCYDNNLESYMSEEFLDVVWLCKRKTK